MTNLTRNLYEREEVVAALKWSVINGRVMETAFWCQELLESDAAAVAHDALVSTWIWHFGIGCIGIGQQLLSSAAATMEIAVTLARMRSWRDGAVLALLAGGAAVTAEFDRVSEWDADTAGAPPRQRSFHRALKQRKALLAWCYARTAWPAAGDWIDERWLLSFGPRWPMRALAVAAAALTPKERAESAAKKWRLLPTDIEAALIEWDSLIGRARRVYAIPSDCLFWITARGLSPGTTTNIVTLTSRLDASLEESEYWRRQLPIGWARREEAYERFYDMNFPTDIPDEWSRADREKSHGGGVLSLNEVPSYAKYVRRWFGSSVSRVMWGSMAGAAAIEDLDALYEAKQAEWRYGDAKWKLTPAKKVLTVVKHATKNSASE
jgi:hypothetical protein